MEIVARYGAGPKVLAGVWVDSLLPAHPTKIRSDIPVGIHIYWHIKCSALYPTNAMQNASTRMMPIAPSIGRVPGLTAARHSAPATVARIPNMRTSRMTMRLMSVFGYFLRSH